MTNSKIVNQETSFVSCTAFIIHKMCGTLNNSVLHINHLPNIKDLWDIVMHYGLARKDETRDQNIAIVMIRQDTEL